MKYIKLYFKYIKLSIMSKLSYKASSILGILAFLITEVTSIATLFLIVSTVPSLKGYSLYEIGLLYGLVNMAIGIDHLLTDRLWTVAYFEVVRGKMDSVFLRPLPTLFQVIASEFQTEALGEILTSIGLLIFCSINLSFEVTFMKVFMIIVGILGASLSITSFKIILSSLAFLIKRSGPLLQIVYNFSTYSKYPLNIYPKVIQIVLTFVIPIGLCIFYPADALFGNSSFSPLLIILTILFPIIFFIFAVFIWNKLSKHYESTGS